MSLHDRRAPWFAASTLAFACLAACSGDDSGSASDSQGSSSTTDDPSATATTTAGSASMSASATDPSGTGTDSATDGTGETEAPTTSASASDGTTTNNTTTDGTSTDSTTTDGVTDGTATDPTTDPTGSTTAPNPECQQDADCPKGQICANEMCMDPPPECGQDADCGAEQYCDAGKCKDKCKPGDGGGGNDIVEDSYIWIPSQDSGQISKVDTLTLTEVARYRTGPMAGTESPSRTAVSADGRFVIVNNRGTGRATVFAAQLSDCIDKNNNGMIETSQSPANVLPWLEDECMRYTVTFPQWGGAWANGPRGVTWTVGTWNDDPNVCAWENPKIWLGYRSNLPNNTAHLVRLDGLTGVVEETVAVPNWVGQSGFAPYGGALDPQQRPWFSALRGEIVRVNADQNPITVDRWTAPAWVQTYGFTVDQQGNPWMAGCTGPVSTFDVPTQQWISIAGTSACHRGIAVDNDMHVWVASNSPCGVVEIDGKTRTLIAKHNLPVCSTAIGPSVDVENHVWIVDQSARAWKIIDKNVPGAKLVNVPGSHYVYSDMTGGQVRSVSAQ